MQIGIIVVEGNADHNDAVDMEKKWNFIIGVQIITRVSFQGHFDINHGRDVLMSKQPNRFKIHLMQFKTAFP